MKIDVLKNKIKVTVYFSNPLSFKKFLLQTMIGKDLSKNSSLERGSAKNNQIISKFKKLYFYMDFIQN